MFTRKSTGLVREGRWIDSFIFNSSSSWLFGPLIFAIADLYYLSGADLISAEGIALIFALGIAVMYAILTSLMPRSGGDYVFNSRILHPSVGFAFNFSLCVWQLFSAAFTLYFIANVALSPGLEVLGFFGHAPLITQIGIQLGQPTNSFIFATVVNVLFTLVMLSGIRRTFSALDVLWGLTILGTAVMIASLLATSTASFHSAFNNYVFSSNGTASVPDPYSFVLGNGAPNAIPYVLVIPAIAICASSVIWVFWETYLGGEIRRTSSAKRNISTMAGAAILNAGLFSVLVYLLYKVVGYQFLAAVTTTIIPGSINSPLQAVTAVLILTTGNFYGALVVILAATLGYSVILLPALYLQPIRSVFAWSFDRIVPTKMSEVSSRFRTPLITTIAIFIVIEAALVLINSMYNSLLAIFFAVIIGPAFSSIFPTALSAIALKFGRRRTILEGSPLGHGAKSYLITFVGLTSLGFILFMTYVFVSNEALFGLNNYLVVMNFIFIPIGAIIYFFSWSFRRAKSRLDLNKIMMEIPPE